MGILDNELWRADLNEVVDAFPELEKLAGKRVFVTGSTGLICSAVIDLFICFNERNENRILIEAAGRSPEKICRRFGSYAEKEWFSIIPYDASSSENRLTGRFDYVIHGAGNASPDMIVKEPVETMISNFLGLHELLDYARKVHAERVLFISSSEIYGKKNEDQPYEEGEYGYIDLLNPRNSYSEGKRASETLCASYTAEYGMDTVIVRPGHIYGPTASRKDSRVSSKWAYDAAEGKDIVMKSSGEQMRSYCYCLDCASAILTVLLSGGSTCAYNISNPDSIISIRRMAEILSDASGVKLVRDEASEAEKKKFNPMSNSSLDGKRLTDLGWRGIFSAEKGLSHTVSILKAILEKQKNS